MLLCQLLRPELIKIGLEARNKRQAVHELVDVLLQQHEISLSQRAHLVEAVLENDRSLPSGMEKGIAVPHAMTDQVEDILCALGTAPHGIGFDSRDGHPADLIVLLIAPRRNYIGEVQALAGIQALLQNPELKQEIVLAASAVKAFDVIRSKELCAA